MACGVITESRRHRQAVWRGRPASRGTRHRVAVCSLSRALALGMWRDYSDHDCSNSWQRRTCMRCCCSCAILRILQIWTPLSGLFSRSCPPSRHVIAAAPAGGVARPACIGLHRGGIAGGRREQPRGRQSQRWLHFLHLCPVCVHSGHVFINLRIRQPAQTFH
jgi:hypothetical protein